MGRHIDNHEWQVIQKSSDNLVEWDKKQHEDVETTIKAIQKNNIGLFTKMIKEGVNIYLPIDVASSAPFQQFNIVNFVCFFEKMEFLRILDKKLVNYGIRANGFDAVDCALLAKNGNALDVLLNKNSVNLKKITPKAPIKIILATQGTYLYGVQKLLYAGANPETKDEQGKTALWHNMQIRPATPDDIEIGRILMGYGALKPEDIEMDDLDIPQKAVLEEGIIKQDMGLVQEPSTPTVTKKPKPRIL